MPENKRCLYPDRSIATIRECDLAAAKRQFSSVKQGDLFAIQPGLPGGFDYDEDIITPDYEQALLLQLADLRFEPFEFHGYAAKRRVVSFGWRDDYAGGTLSGSNPIPQFLLPLRECVAAFARVPPDSLQQILINEYAPGAGIGWHRDRPMFEDLIAISLASVCVLRLRRKQETGWERASQAIRPRSAYLLRGSSRREWEHSIPPVAHLRYSVTFRNFADDEIRGSTSAPRRIAVLRKSS